MHEKLLVIIGPSGTGKSSLVIELAKQNIIELTPTWTDRPTRPSEQDIEHTFVSSKELEHKTKTGFFVHEPQPMFGLAYRYGLPFIAMPPKDKIPAIMMRASVLGLVKHYYPNAIVYHIEAPKRRVELQLSERQKQGVLLGTRLADYETEINEGRKHAHRVFNNDDFPATLATMKAALVADFLQEIN